DDTATFNQIKGKNMVAYFTDNELKKITVNGNSQTIYFVREENGELIGINKAVSSKMLIFLENKQMKTITYIDFPKETLFPEKDLSPKDIILKGFKWLEEKRPRNKMEIFYW
ncbi:MAG: organic solvent tolerance protein OstA, partial [Bacteroidales bacterium]|nr:organic solvent tolerance protein OstA [Bacteroidales bacterium]